MGGEGGGNLCGFFCLFVWGGRYAFLCLIALGHRAESWTCVFFELHGSSPYLYATVCTLFLRCAFSLWITFYCKKDLMLQRVFLVIIFCLQVQNLPPLCCTNSAENQSNSGILWFRCFS